MVVGVAEAAVNPVGTHGDARLHEQTVELRLNTQQGLAHGLPGPGGRTGEPAVLSLAGLKGIFSGHHLAEHIRLHFPEGLILCKSRRNLLIMPPGILGPAGHGLADNHPGIVVAEDAGVLFITFRIGTDFAVVNIVLGVGRVVQDQAVLAFQILFCGVQRFVAEAFFRPDAGHGAPALALDENLSLFAFAGANLVAKIIVGPKEPFTVPAVLFNGSFHSGHSRLYGGGVAIPYPLQELGKIPALGHKQAGDHQGFGLGAFRLVLGGLEGVVGVVRETVEI